MKRVMLYFGSYNPIHNGHIALAEYVIDEGLCDELIMIVSPQNPLKCSSKLIPELERFSMAELAANSSKYPDRIKASVIEFMLPKPSYTINTLRHLSEEYGHLMQFSILMGGDLVGQLEQWRDWQEILANYPIYVYPRRGECVERHREQITLLEGAPYFDISSTEIRERISFLERVDEMLPIEVQKYIKQGGFYVQDEPISAAQFIERGRTHYKQEAWGDAQNSFAKALSVDPDSNEARELLKMIQEILKYRYTDIYNP